MTDRHELAKKIRLLRGSLTKVEAARRSKLSREWWTAAEEGDNIPQAPKLAQAAETLGGDVEDLLRTAGYDPTPYIQAPVEITGAGAVSDTVAGTAHISQPDRELRAVVDTLARDHEELTEIVLTLTRRMLALEQRLEGGAAGRESG